MKHYSAFPPIMENLTGEDLRFSIDFSFESAPGGSITFFEKYGYVVIEGLGKNTSNDEYFNKVFKILTKNLKFKIEKNSHYEVVFTNKNIDISLPKSDITTCTLNNSNLNLVQVYITTKNKQKHRVNLDYGRIIVYDKSVKIKRYNPNMNFFHRFLYKLIPSDFYSHQSFFNFNLE